MSWLKITNSENKDVTARFFTDKLNKVGRKVVKTDHSQTVPEHWELSHWEKTILGSVNNSNQLDHDGNLIMTLQGGNFDSEPITVIENFFSIPDYEEVPPWASLVKMS